MKFYYCQKIFNLNYVILYEKNYVILYEKNYNKLFDNNKILSKFEKKRSLLMLII